MGIRDILADAQATAEERVRKSSDAITECESKIRVRQAACKKAQNDAEQVRFKESQRQGEYDALAFALKDNQDGGPPLLREELSRLVLELTALKRTLFVANQRVVDRKTELTDARDDLVLAQRAEKEAVDELKRILAKVIEVNPLMN